MIVASNGMLTGGRVVGHLRNLIDDPTATILFVGYQGEGTLGAHLQAGAETVKLDGQVRRGPLPGPLDQRLLGPRRRERAARLAAAGSRAGKRPGDPGYPRRVFLVHGDPEAPDRARAEGPRPRASRPTSRTGTSASRSTEPVRAVRPTPAGQTAGSRSAGSRVGRHNPRWRSDHMHKIMPDSSCSASR